MKSDADITWDRVLVSALIGAVIGVVALLANHHIPKLADWAKEEEES
jgi:hypothetical protein